MPSSLTSAADARASASTGQPTSRVAPPNSPPRVLAESWAASADVAPARCAPSWHSKNLGQHTGSAVDSGRASPLPSPDHKRRPLPLRCQSFSFDAAPPRRALSQQPQPHSSKSLTFDLGALRAASRWGLHSGSEAEVSPQRCLRGNLGQMSSFKLETSTSQTGHTDSFVRCPSFVESPPPPRCAPSYARTGLPPRAQSSSFDLCTSAQRPSASSTGLPPRSMSLSFESGTVAPGGDARLPARRQSTDERSFAAVQWDVSRHSGSPALDENKPTQSVAQNLVTSAMSLFGFTGQSRGAEHQDSRSGDGERKASKTRPPQTMSKNKRCIAPSFGPVVDGGLCTPPLRPRPAKPGSPASPSRLLGVQQRAITPQLLASQIGSFPTMTSFTLSRCDSFVSDWK